MRNFSSITAIFLAAALLLTACNPGFTPTAAPAPKNTVAPVQPAWQTGWDRAVRGARDEGNIVIASLVAETARQSLAENFKAKFGLTAEFVSGRPAEFAPKILAERRAGLYLEDMMIGGGETGLSTLKPAAALDRLDPVLLLPEVVDGKAWYSGNLPWFDKDHTVLSFIASAQPAIIINTTLVKPGEIKSFRDLLDPKWKGKIILGDPTVGGSGNGIFSAMVEGIMDVNFVRSLAKQEPVIAKDERLLGEWLARGKYPIAMGIGTETVTEFMRAGAPIDIVTPVEGTYVSASTGVVLLLRNAPHPNAATVVINWLLSKEGGTVFSNAIGGQSARVDVPTDFLHPSRVRQPGGKYLMTGDEDYIAKKTDNLKLAKEIFADSLK